MHRQLQVIQFHNAFIFIFIFIFIFCSEYHPKVSSETNIDI